MSEQPQELAPTANANDNNDLATEIERLRSTNERLLHESQTNKTKRSELEELRSLVDSYKSKELEATGNWQERLKQEQEKRNELERKLHDQSNKILKSNIVNAVGNYAKDAYDVNDLLAQSDFAKMIEVDEETLEPIGESVEKFVNSLKEKKKYLFKGHKLPSMADGKPGINKPVEKNINQMSKQEAIEAMRSSFQELAKTRG